MVIYIHKKCLDVAADVADNATAVAGISREPVPCKQPDGGAVCFAS